MEWLHLDQFLEWFQFSNESETYILPQFKNSLQSLC